MQVVVHRKDDPTRIGMPAVFGVSAAGYLLSFDNGFQQVFKSLRAFSNEWVVLSPKNAIRNIAAETRVIPKIHLPDMSYFPPVNISEDVRLKLKQALAEQYNGMLEFEHKPHVDEPQQRMLSAYEVHEALCSAEARYSVSAPVFDLIRKLLNLPR